MSTVTKDPGSLVFSTWQTHCHDLAMMDLRSAQNQLASVYALASNDFEREGSGSKPKEISPVSNMLVTSNH